MLIDDNMVSTRQQRRKQSITMRLKGFACSRNGRDPDVLTLTTPVLATYYPCSHFHNPLSLAKSTIKLNYQKVQFSAKPSKSSQR